MRRGEGYLFITFAAPKPSGRRSRKPGIDRKPRQAYSAKQLERLEAEFKVRHFIHCSYNPPCAIIFSHTFLALADRQVSQREQADGAVQVLESDRGANQDVVPESPYEVEEAAHVQTEDRAKAGTVSTDVFPDHPVPSSPVLRGAFDVRYPFIGRREF